MNKDYAHKVADLYFTVGAPHSRQDAIFIEQNAKWGIKGDRLIGVANPKTLISLRFDNPDTQTYGILTLKPKGHDPHYPDGDMFVRIQKGIPQAREYEQHIVDEFYDRSIIEAEAIKRGWDDFKRLQESGLSLASMPAYSWTEKTGIGGKYKTLERVSRNSRDESLFPIQIEHKPKTTDERSAHYTATLNEDRVLSINSRHRSQRPQDRNIEVIVHLCEDTAPDIELVEGYDLHNLPEP